AVPGVGTRLAIGLRGGSAADPIRDSGAVVGAGRLEVELAGELATRGRFTEVEPRARLEQVAVRCDDRGRQLLQRRDVHDPDGTGVRAGNELAVAWVDLQIMHGHGRQTRHEPLPGTAAIE